MNAVYDTLSRKVLVAVELLDPATLAPVYQGVRLRAVGLNRTPLLNWSGRFVWLFDGTRWPSEFVFDPGTMPYEARTYPAPPRPADLDQLASAERLQRIVLSPGAAYPFSDDLSGVRGQLRESAAQDAAPIAGATVVLRPKATPAPQPGEVVVRTNADGEFSACLRRPGDFKPDRGAAMLSVYFLVEHGGERRQRMLQLPDGQFSDSPVALDWSALKLV